MLRRAFRLGLTVLSALSLVLCAAAAALWVQSYRQWYSLSVNRVDERALDWGASAWSVMLEPSCVYVKYEGPHSWSKTVVLPEPKGEIRILVNERPPTGFRWSFAFADARWDSGINRTALYWELGRFAGAGGDFPKHYRSFRLFVIPLYAIVALTALLPVVWMRGRLRTRQVARRAAAGMCPTCGY